MSTGVVEVGCDAEKVSVAGYTGGRQGKGSMKSMWVHGRRSDELQRERTGSSAGCFCSGIWLLGMDKRHRMAVAFVGYRSPLRFAGDVNPYENRDS